MALPMFYKLAFENQSGDTIDSGTLDVFSRAWKRDSSGAIVYQGSEQTPITPAGTVLTDTIEQSSEIDNSTDLYEGIDIYIELNTGASTDGVFNFYIIPMTDTGRVPVSNADITKCPQINSVYVGSDLGAIEWGFRYAG